MLAKTRARCGGGRIHWQRELHGRTIENYHGNYPLSVHLSGPLSLLLGGYDTKISFANVQVRSRPKINRRWQRRDQSTSIAVICSSASGRWCELVMRLDICVSTLVGTLQFTYYTSCSWEGRSHSENLSLSGGQADNRVLSLFLRWTGWRRLLARSPPPSRRLSSVPPLASCIGSLYLRVPIGVRPFFQQARTLVRTYTYVAVMTVVVKVRSSSCAAMSVLCVSA